MLSNNMNKSLIDLIKLGTIVTLAGLTMGCSGIRQHGASGYIGRECLFGTDQEYETAKEKNEKLELDNQAGYASSDKR